jgi:hypothetical protein
VNQEDREQLDNKIARYRELARQAPDPETAQRIKTLVAELEQKLRQIQQ